MALDRLACVLLCIAALALVAGPGDRPSVGSVRGTATPDLRTPVPTQPHPESWTPLPTQLAYPGPRAAAAPEIRWLDTHRAELVVTGPAELSLRRGSWTSPTLLIVTDAGEARIVLPDDVGGPRDAGWVPRIGDVWVVRRDGREVGRTEALDAFRWRVWAPWVGR